MNSFSLYRNLNNIDKAQVLQFPHSNIQIPGPFLDNKCYQWGVDPGRTVQNFLLALVCVCVCVCVCSLTVPGQTLQGKVKFPLLIKKTPDTTNHTDNRKL